MHYKSYIVVLLVGIKLICAAHSTDVYVMLYKHNNNINVMLHNSELFVTYKKVACNNKLTPKKEVTEYT